MIPWKHPAVSHKSTFFDKTNLIKYGLRVI